MYVYFIGTVKSIRKELNKSECKKWPNIFIVHFRVITKKYMNLIYTNTTLQKGQFTLMKLKANNHILSFQKTYLKQHRMCKEI